MTSVHDETGPRPDEHRATDYVSGPYAPVTDEITAFDLPVDGEIPEQLEGRYLRNGPNPSGPVDPATHHWFMGDGMVHGLRLRGGRAEWYRNRYVAPAGDADDGFGPNTNVAGFAGTTWATVEAGVPPFELSYELDPVGANRFSGTLPNGFTAHPKLDPATGELHAVAYSWAELLDHVQYLVVGVDGRVRRAVDVRLPGMSMVHDMSLTERYAIVYDQPCTVDLDVALAGRFPFRWDPDYGNRVGLLPREGEATDIIWIDVPLGYSFHPLNAYDTDGGGVVIDLCVYDRIFDRDVNGPAADGLPRLERWELDPAHRRATTTVLDERPNEFPRHRGELTGRPHRFGYCVSNADDLTAGWPTVKHDLVTGERWELDHGPGRISGEPVFVGRPGSDPVADEDDGWLLTFVHGASSTEFVILDARDLARGPVAQVPLPQRVPLGFHGNWVSDDIVAPPS
ncbi:MAG: carotenoid oxygenase family protein [Ilumatobacteraceae bacterium]